MKADIRYNLQHIGDVFIDAVQKTADSAVAFSKGIIRNYDPDSLSFKKKKISRTVTKGFSGLIKGDRIAGVVQKTADAAVVFSKRLVRRYEITVLKSRKKKISEEIIERASVLAKSGSGAVGRDTALSKLVSSLQRIENDLAGYKRKRTRPVGPVTAILTKLGTALFSAKKNIGA